LNKRALVAFVAALVCSSAANATLPYFGVYGEATAVAITSDGLPESVSQAGSPATDALTASAASVGAVDVATAGSIVAFDLLTTSADVSASDFGSAVSTARYAGVFVNPAVVDLGIQFTQLDSAGGTGAATTTLFVSLVSDGVSLFRDYVTSPTWSMSYTPVVGTVSLLEILLTSEANAAFLAPGAGGASAFGQVSVVPEVSTWLMLSIGLGAVGAAARRRALRELTPA
jgi:hypothetical protein